MLEILAVFFCCKTLGDMLRRKGRKPLVFQILLVISWFGAEVLAGAIYGIVQVVIHGGEPPELGFAVYLVALLAAAAAAGFWILVAYLLPPVDSQAVVAGYREFPGGSAVGNFAPPSDPHNPYAPPRSQN